MVLVNFDLKLCFEDTAMQLCKKNSWWKFFSVLKPSICRDGTSVYFNIKWSNVM